MKAIVQTGPKSVELQERDDPSPSETEALVRVHTTGLCGSDASAFKYDGGYEFVKLPRIMGHEYSGTVVDTGEDVTEFQEGDKVIEEPIRECGVCFQCKNGQHNVCQNFSITGLHDDGAYADYIAVDTRYLHRVPEGVSLRNAALTEPTSIATRAVFERSSVIPGEFVLVEGPGPIGALIALVADSLGANVLVSGLEKDSHVRMPILEDQGIATLNVEEEDLAERRERFTGGRGFDVVFDTTGHNTGPEMAVEHVRKGGQIVIVGLPGSPSELYVTPLVRGEIDMLTSYGSTWKNFEQALRVMENGTIRPEALMDESFEITEPTKAFDAFLEARSLKPIFSFGS